MDLISVIIPIYNTAPYLSKCVDSVLSQTYPNLEIILVDDGSTDKSPVICDSYADLHPQIRVIHQLNQGVSAARNRGIAESKGEYLTFVDSDDIIEPDMIQRLSNNAIHYDVALSVCLLDVVNIDGSNKPLDNGTCGLYSNKDILLKYFSDQFIKDQLYSPVNKLFKKELIREIHFKPYCIGEDILFIFEVLQQCDKIYIDKYVGYHYLHRENSATTAKFNPKRLDYILAGEDILQLAKLNWADIVPAIEQWLFVHTIVALRQLIIFDSNYKTNNFFREKKQWIHKYHRLFWKINIRRKLDFIGIIYCPYYFKLLTSVR